MSQNYNGQPGNTIANLPLQILIASSTFGVPLSVTTNAPHGLTTGDYVRILGHTGNSAANGVWPITVTGGLGSATFTIPTTGTTTGGATGVVQPLKAGVTLQMPSDGDAENASSVTPSIEEVADRTMFLGLCAGGQKIVGYRSVVHNDDSNAAWVTVADVMTAGGWGAVSGLGSGLGLDLPTLPSIGDTLLVRWAFTVGAITTTGGTTKMRLGLLWSALGSPPGFSKIPGSSMTLSLSDTMPRPVVLMASLPVAVNATTAVNANQINIGANPVDGANAGISLIGDYTVEAWILRSTSMPQ